MSVWFVLGAATSVVFFLSCIVCMLGVYLWWLGQKPVSSRSIVASTSSVEAHKSQAQTSPASHKSPSRSRDMRPFEAAESKAPAVCRAAAWEGGDRTSTPESNASASTNTGGWSHEGRSASQGRSAPQGSGEATASGSLRAAADPTRGSREASASGSGRGGVSVGLARSSSGSVSAHQVPGHPRPSCGAPRTPSRGVAAPPNGVAGPRQEVKRVGPPITIDDLPNSLGGAASASHINTKGASGASSTRLSNRGPQRSLSSEGSSDAPQIVVRSV